VRVGALCSHPPFRYALPGRCAWLSYARGRAVLCRSRGRPRTPLLCCARPGRCAWPSSARGHAVLYGSRGKNATPLLHGARPDHCARLGLLRRACELDCRSWGRRTNPPSPLRSALPLRLASAKGTNKGGACTYQAAVICDDQSKAWVLPWREISAIAL
jgi:hypothetical protein